jgi:hypothetical protein
LISDHINETTSGGPSAGGPSAVDLALQVAQIAAQVSLALQNARRLGEQAGCDDLEGKLAMAQERLEREGAPPGLIPFIDVLRGMLRGDDVSARARGLPGSYRAVYQQLANDLEAQEQEEEGRLTLREVLDQVTHNVILVIKGGSFEQRRRMADTLLTMEYEAEQRPDLVGLRDLARAARFLLMGGDPTPVVEQLQGPFRDKWQEIADAIRD